MTGLAAGAPVYRRDPLDEPEAEVTRLRTVVASAKLNIEILREVAAYFTKTLR
ncbi:hypothetical protein [Burkholderia sp. SCN-KJ]|uniref:hypothetical protein n=1 Tax=Burkholderia sp. SCN-KJ TaxID=2969248 RepID=UPI00214F6D6D|nr:hypothetical protein [Burkholderia sp. SCN-KJ]MCR4470476.1 hypothetical protein [Burkholderia sp. SCN-KJ]